MSLKLFRIRPAGWAGVLLVALGITWGGGTAIAQAPFGSAEDVAFSKALWSALEDAKLIGSGQITTVPYVGRDPHGMILETLTSEITVNGKRGTVIVKRNYGGPGISLSKVATGRDRFLAAITVMFKRESGFNPAGKDWFWAKYKADSSLDVAPNNAQMAGRVAGCIACHTTAVGGGMIFTTTADYLEQ